jgi:predicted GNAT family N-acyltransferase
VVFVADESEVTVRPARDATELDAARALRMRVFVDEQGVAPGEEFDDLDAEALQIVALDESGVIATCRLRDIGRAIWKLERMAVDGRVRGLGVGARLLAGAEGEARARGAAEILLHAQRRAEAFYAARGYAAEGDTFVEAGIDHVAMRKAL